ncbi:fumarylacetoacetate hydrolase family protein [Methylocystis bryophila]|uniref:Fumarylacetoacetase n=1 Tax=Methylocystis bryophila TaxID=655015 RepID=A0A1W6N087_9HYPH|nr:fumarylacetoacetate hydrolase family protein [Methylocystis bryophila]ARN83196.1 fumarylacetoacetase [Methylocystis bryophila]BDV39535.1 fumarylacetoacetase [Methylocystis bryophila]
MQFHRVLSPDGSSIETQARINDEWRKIDAPSSVFSPEWELAKRRERGLSPALPLLPFQPLSFRDFMLFERHAIDAARGWARRFAPRAFRLARAYEALTGRDFPAFRPASLYYRQPIYYMGNALSFVPSGAPVAAPAYSQALDYELELGFVLGAPLFNATPQEAEAAIGAFVVLNDFSARDVQRDEMQSGFGPQKAKHFLSSMSQTAVTKDEILPRLPRLEAHVEINGERVAETNFAGMRYSLGEALAFVSQSEPLFAGELFGSGTPTGGSGMEIGRWLKIGDRLRLVIEGVGEIAHEIVERDR